MPAKKCETPLQQYLQSKQLQAFVTAAENDDIYFSMLSQQLFPAFHFDRETSATLQALPPQDFALEFEKLGIQLGTASGPLADAFSSGAVQMSADYQPGVAGALATTEAAAEYCKEAERLVDNLEKLFKTQAFDLHVAQLGRCETVQPAVKDALGSLAGVLAEIDEVAARFARYAEQIAQLYQVVI